MTKLIQLSSILILSAVGIFIIDQNIKAIFIDGFRYYTNCIDLILVYNKGVAFSMLSFLGEYLKYIQLILIFGVIAYVLRLGKLRYSAPIGLMSGAALSNIYDRFIHSGVVDMVYWHCWFDFAVFNFADVVIDISVAWIVLLNLKDKQ